MKKPYKKGGFTLIELLVVISLIFIFITFVTPKLFAFRDKAKDLKAINTAKQIQAAVFSNISEGADKVLPEDIKNLTGVEVNSIEEGTDSINIEFKSDNNTYSTKIAKEDDSEFIVLKGDKQLYPHK